MKKFIEIIKKKWLIDTSKTFILVALCIIVFLAINIGVKRLGLTPIDVTSSKLYSLSDESKEKIKEVSLNVSIYFFGIEDDTSVVSLAKQYSKVNDKITVEVVDSSERPDLIEKYGVTDDAQGIVVQAPDRFKVLSTSDFTDYDYSTGESTDLTEQKLTNAIIDTTISKKPTLYFLSGHGESSKLVRLQTYLANEVNDVETLDLLTTSFPDNCDCLIIASPTKDFGDIETDQIINYINNGGKILWINDNSSTYPNTQKILDLYGAKLTSGTVRETDDSKMILYSNSYIVPNISYHKITSQLATSGSLAFVDSCRIDVADDDILSSLGVSATPFIKSSSTSYFRTDYTNTSSDKADSEESGPFNLGVEFTKLINNKESKLILYSNAKFATDSINVSNGTQTQSIVPILLYNNKDLLLNSVAYLTDREDSITIRKNTGSVTYTATDSEDLMIRIIIFVFPIIIILLGFIVWFTRRRKK